MERRPDACEAAKVKCHYNLHRLTPRRPLHHRPLITPSTPTPPASARPLPLATRICSGNCKPPPGSKSTHAPSCISLTFGTALPYPTLHQPQFISDGLLLLLPRGPHGRHHRRHPWHWPGRCHWPRRSWCRHHLGPGASRHSLTMRRLWLPPRSIPDTDSVPSARHYRYRH